MLSRRQFFHNMIAAAAVASIPAVAKAVAPSHNEIALRLFGEALPHDNDTPEFHVAVNNLFKHLNDDYYPSVITEDEAKTMRLFWGRKSPVETWQKAMDAMPMMTPVILARALITTFEKDPRMSPEFGNFITKYGDIIAAT